MSQLVVETTVLIYIYVCVGRRIGPVGVASVSALCDQLFQIIPENR